MPQKVCEFLPDGIEDFTDPPEIDETDVLLQECYDFLIRLGGDTPSPEVSHLLQKISKFCT